MALLTLFLKIQMKGTEQRSGKLSTFIPSDICWIHNPSHQHDKPGELVIDDQHEGSVEGNSRWDGEVQRDVGSAPLVQLCLFHFQRDLLRALSVAAQHQKSLHVHFSVYNVNQDKSLTLTSLSALSRNILETSADSEKTVVIPALLKRPSKLYDFLN